MSYQVIVSTADGEKYAISSDELADRIGVMSDSEGNVSIEIDQSQDNRRRTQNKKKRVRSKQPGSMQEMHALFMENMRQMQQRMMQQQMMTHSLQMMDNRARKQMMQELIDEVARGEEVVDVEAKPLPEP